MMSNLHHGGFSGSAARQLLSQITLFMLQLSKPLQYIQAQFIECITLSKLWAIILLTHFVDFTFIFPHSQYVVINTGY